MTSRQRFVLAGLLLAGVVVRLVPYLASPSLYLDEAMLALNLAGRDWTGLVRALDFEQSAPIFFLWLARLGIELAGASERVLRVVPLLAGLMLAPLVWVFARRWLPAPAALFATGIAALSPLAVWYANVAKPYAVDAAVATAFLLLVGPLLRADDRPARWLAAGVGGIVAMFLSAPTVFLIPGVMAMLALRRNRWNDPGYVRNLVLLGSVFLIGLAANYLLFQGDVTGDPYLQRFYDQAFLWPPRVEWLQRVSELVSGMAEFFFYGRLVAIPAPALVATVVLVLLGLLYVRRRGGWPGVALFLSPFIAVGGAALIRVYPPVERLLLFLTPFLAVLAAAGLVMLVESLPDRWRGGAFAGLAVLILLPAGLYDGSLVRRPRGEGAEAAPVIAAYQELRQPGDPVYVFSRGLPIWIFYTTDWASPDPVRLRDLLAGARQIGPNSGNAPSRGRPVEREGWDLMVPSGDHVELVGIASGVEVLYRRTMRLNPDPGWSENEVARMRDVARPRIWAFITHHARQVADDLERSISEAGGVITERLEHWAVALWLVRFPARDQP